MRYPTAVFRLATISMLALFIQSCRSSDGHKVRYGFGKPATAAQIAAWDHDVRPDGKGLPEGSGTVQQGRTVYQAKCAACHGITGREGPQHVLVGAYGDTTKDKTIGNYWPYATTLYDYIYRAMPQFQPESLSHEEVYALTAFLLYQNKLIDSNTVMNKISLPAVRMPALVNFVPDNRKNGPIVR